MANGIVEGQVGFDRIIPENSEEYLSTYQHAVRPSEAVAAKTFFEPIGDNFQGIISSQSRETSDKVIQDWLNGFGVISKERQSPVEPIVAPAPSPAPASAPTPESSITLSLGAPNPAGDAAARNRIFAGTAAREAGIVNEAMLQAQDVNRQRAEADFESLQTRRDLGLEPKTGMSEYEANASKMREDTRIEGLIKALPANVRGVPIAAALESAGRERVARTGAVSDLTKANTATQYKIYENAIKSQAEWAKLGIQAQDVQSKMKYRESMIDDLITRNGLIEPMKLRLAQAKNSADQVKVRRDFAVHALDKAKEDQMTEYRDKTMKMGGTTPELQEMFNNIQTNYQMGMSNIRKTIPMEGDIDQFGDRVGKFTNGKWVDITDQFNNKGIVGGA